MNVYVILHLNQDSFSKNYKLYYKYVYNFVFRVLIYLHISTFYVFMYEIRTKLLKMKLCFMGKIINLLFKEKKIKLLQKITMLSFVSDLKFLLIQKYILKNYIF